jgi:hypothetical protein
MADDTGAQDRKRPLDQAPSAPGRFRRREGTRGIRNSLRRAPRRIQSGGDLISTTDYTAVRPEDPLLSTPRTWLHAPKGGVMAIPTWGKFWLAVLGLYGYQGLNPIPPEMFLLPKWLPFHPHHITALHG